MGGHHTDPVATGGAGRLHAGRLHRRRRREHGDLPQWDQPASVRDWDDQCRAGPRRVLAAGAVHHQFAWAKAGPAPPGKVAMSSPGQAGPEHRGSNRSTAGTDSWWNDPSPGLFRGNRKIRYRSTRKNDHWLHLRVDGLNLRRLLMLGITRTDGRAGPGRRLSGRHRAEPASKSRLSTLPAGQPPSPHPGNCGQPTRHQQPQHSGVAPDPSPSPEAGRFRSLLVGPVTTSGPDQDRYRLAGPKPEQNSGRY